VDVVKEEDHLSPRYRLGIFTSGVCFSNDVYVVRRPLLLFLFASLNISTASPQQYMVRHLLSASPDSPGLSLSGLPSLSYVCLLSSKILFANLYHQLAECIKASSRSESYEHIPIPLRDARTRRSASLDEGVVETEGLMTSRDTSLAPHHTVGDDDFSDEEEKDHDHPSSHPYGPNGQTIPSKTSSIFSNSAARLSRPNIGHDETAIVQPDEIDNDGVGVDMSSERRREENGIESKGGMILVESPLTSCICPTESRFIGNTQHIYCYPSISRYRILIYHVCDL
jgi:hypothetical protein